MKPTASEILWYLAMATPPGEGSNNYNALNNKPKIENITLTGALTAAQLGLLRLEVVTVLPDEADMTRSTLYIHRDFDVDPPVGPLFYVFTAQDELIELKAGSDYSTLIKKPEIDENVLEAENNTHESLELISERDFVVAHDPTKVDGMEIVYGPGTPADPVEITEIDDSLGMKYAENYTSSNKYINTKFDELFRITKSQMQVHFASVLPATPDINSIYYINTGTENEWHVYLVDSIGNVQDAGVMGFQMDGKGYETNIWEGRLRSRNEMVIDLSGYSRIFCNCKIWGMNAMLEVDLEHDIWITQYPSDFPWQTSMLRGYTGYLALMNFDGVSVDNRMTCYWANVYVTRNKDKLYFVAGRHLPGQQYSEIVSNEYFELTAIDGIGG